MAFLFAVEEMYEHWPKSVYMWTFTFEKFQPDWRAMMRWAELKEKLFGTEYGGRLKCEFPGVRGLRVVEVHPGNNFHGLSHGLHFHCLLNKRVCVHAVRRIGRKFGFGRIQARRVTQEEAAYLGKYLTKKQPELSKGARRWGTINWPEACKVRDIKIESTFHRNIEKVQQAVKQSQLTADIIHSIFVNTRIHGEYKEWPTERYYYSGRSREVLGQEDQSTRVQEFADPTLVGKMLPRSNIHKRTREQSMQRQAEIWKEKARRRAMGFEACVAEDSSKARQARVELEAKPSEKFFHGPPRVTPGVSPVKEQDGTLSYYVYKRDKNGMIISGTPIA